MKILYVLFLIYIISAIWYQILLYNEAKDWGETSKTLRGIPKLMYILFVLIGFVPLVNTILAIKAHKDNIDNN